MATVSLVLILMLAVAASGFLVRLVPAPVPLPLVQVALGALLAVFTGVGVDLAPSLFFLLFLPPLLFLDGWRIPKEGVRRDRRMILQLALGLVLFTVVGMGFFIHWLIPAVPLGAAFAIAAVLSPTDPVAVSAITARTPTPKRMLHILEGESLLNDASGLVCLRFAVAAVVTGSFSLPQAVSSFAWVSVAGVAIGVGVTWAVTQGKSWLSRRLGEEPGTEILISLLIPFGAYLLAEEAHASGILAAVAAGVTMGYVEIGGQVLAATRVRRSAVWDTIHFTANGMIFVLLGEQMPSILARSVETVRLTGHDEVWWLGVYVLAIVAGLTALRFVWVWVSLGLASPQARRRGERFERPKLRLVAAMALSGVRGAITLAGVLTIPFTVADGTAFPARNLAIFLAAAVILTSLVLASLALPLALKGLDMPAESDEAADEDKARAAAAGAAIRAVESAHHKLAKGRADADVYAEASARILDSYRRRIDSRVGADATAAEARRLDSIERRLRLAGLQAERAELFRLARTREIQDDLARRLVREIDLIETRYRV